MTDTTVAPQGSAPTAAPSEVPVQVDQINRPNPVGPQAPDKPGFQGEGSKHRPESRRESIQRAFERASQPSPKPERKPPAPTPKAAEAKMGHNQPPDDEKLDLRKRPPPDKPVERGEHGHFARRQGQQEILPPEPQSGQPQAPAPQNQPYRYQPEHNRLPPNAPYREPPNRFADHAKGEWHQAPQSVRAEISRMYQEFGKAYNFYKADHEAMKQIREFQQLAVQHKTTLREALTRYVSMERHLRSNPIAGLEQIVNNLDLKTSDGQRLGLRDIAYYVLNQTPEQLRLTQQDNQHNAANQQIAALRQELAQTKNTLQQMINQQVYGYTRSAVDQYADSHPRLDELGDIVKSEIDLGFDLDTAYRRAELLRPSTQAAQTRNPSAQTRPQDKSIYGAPGIANGTARRALPPSKSPRDAVQRAINRLNGR